MKKLHILIVDDDSKFAKELGQVLAGKYYISYAHSYDDAVKTLENPFDVVFLDINLSHKEGVEDKDGIELIETAKNSNRNVIIIMVTGYKNLSVISETIEKGANDFYRKNLTPLESFPIIVEKNLIINEQKRKIQYYEFKYESESSHFIGECPEIRDVKQRLKFAAAHTHINILISGETGTGKQIAAEYLHKNSPRRKEAFITVPLSVQHDGTIESALFGHAKGAFTGAYKTKKGYIEIADKGTLFLDEIGELPLSTQAKLLHFLENKEFTPLGNVKPKKADVQIVCATNRNLEEMVENNQFRRDLYHRINNLQIKLLPLRDREGDINLLIDYYLKSKASAKFNLPEIKVHNKAKKILLEYRWPGNIRELFNVLDECILSMQMKRDEIITSKHIPLRVLQNKKKEKNENFRNQVFEIEQEFDKYLAECALFYLTKRFEEVGWKKGEIHKLIGLNDRFAVRRKILKYFKKHPELRKKYVKISKEYS